MACLLIRIADVGFVRRVFAFGKGNFDVVGQAADGPLALSYFVRRVSPCPARFAATEFQVSAHGFRKRSPARAAASSYAKHGGRFVSAV